MTERIVQIIRNNNRKVCGIVYPYQSKFIAFQKHSKMSMASEQTAIKWIGASSIHKVITQSDLIDIPDDIKKAILKTIIL